MKTPENLNKHLEGDENSQNKVPGLENVPRANQVTSPCYLPRRDWLRRVTGELLAWWTQGRA